MMTKEEWKRKIDKMNEAKEVFALILDVLEGGDRAIDFEGATSTTATTIRIIAKIAADAYDGLNANQKLLEALSQGRFD